mmetsp:Transcript_25802/g.43051  ORF Transcript_25802/g.43051 Transcript_25802/m.43051 type:complete len:173 (+) Transcript_25802:79-597(+)
MAAIFMNSMKQSPRMAMLFQRRMGTSIPVILLQDMEDRGTKGDLIEVKRGFARNFLIPRKLAAYATYDNKVKHMKLNTDMQETSNSNDAFGKELLNKLNLFATSPISFAAPCNASGTLFAAVTKSEIRDLLANKDVVLDDDVSISFNNPIKSIGEHSVIVAGVEVLLEITQP